MDKAGLGPMVSIRYLGEEKCVFLSKDLLTPIQVTLYGIIKTEYKSLSWYLRYLKLMYPKCRL